MSSQQEITDKQCRERAVTDSVHARFRTLLVHCDICRSTIDGNSTSIERHFNEAHPSTRQCCYCKGKVFTYRHIPDDIGEDREPQEFVYHKCKSMAESQ